MTVCLSVCLSVCLLVRRLAIQTVPSSNVARKNCAYFGSIEKY